eukprot:403375809
MDAFGHPISFSYKDQPTFKSTFGGIVTIFSRIALLAYFVVELQSVINRAKYQNATSTVYQNLVNWDKVVQLDRHNFDIGFAMF